MGVAFNWLIKFFNVSSIYIPSVKFIAYSL